MIVIGSSALDTKNSDLRMVSGNHFRLSQCILLLDRMIMNGAKQRKQLGQSCFSFTVMLE